MKLNKLCLLPIFALLLLSTNVVSDGIVTCASKDDITKIFQNIKYANSSNEVNNLYSSSIEYDDLTMSALVYVTEPNIQAVVHYNLKTFQLVSYSIANTNTRPDGESKNDYVATYVNRYLSTTTNTYSSKIYNGYTSSISCTFETNNSINIDTSIETEIGTGGGAYGVEAKAGIKGFFNRAAGYGAGNNFTIEYDLDTNLIELYSCYSIKKTTYYNEFITLVCVSQYSDGWSWFNHYYNWLDYSYYAYITNSIAYDTYSLVES